jgi:DNA polymerase III subunit chi
MAASGDTSGSAGSSAGNFSRPASSADSVPGSDSEAALRVDFYVLEEPSNPARLKVACRLAEKAYLASQTALVWHSDAEELKAFDELLWTFMDGSFVPHEVLSTGGSANEAPVLLSAGTPPSAKFDVLINLSPDIPSCLSQARRVAEVIDGDKGRRRAGRERFKAYRDLGIQPASHNIHD